MSSRHYEQAVTMLALKSIVEACSYYQRQTTSAFNFVTDLHCECLSNVLVLLRNRFDQCVTRAAQGTRGNIEDRKHLRGSNERRKFLR